MTRETITTCDVCGDQYSDTRGRRTKTLTATAGGGHGGELVRIHYCIGEHSNIQVATALGIALVESDDFDTKEDKYGNPPGSYGIDTTTDGLTFRLNTPDRDASDWL